MATRELPTSGRKGVQIRDGKLRIRVVYRGEWVYESIDLPANVRGIIQAAKAREQVNRESRAGIIVWSDWFPNSSRIEQQVVIPTFGEIATQWLRLRTIDVKPSTLKSYTKRIEGFWRPAFGHMPISAIRKSHVREALVVIGWTSGKTMSNGLTPLRGVFELAIDDGLIQINPANKIKVPKTQRKPCSPCTVDEMHSIIKHLASPSWQDYFRVAFGTGMRTSELIGLKWPDVNIKAGTVRIHSARTDNVDTGTTKTMRERTLQLTPMALLGFKNQRWRTRGKGHIFALTNGQPIRSDQAPRRAWQIALKNAEIPHKRAYETRSTFATLHLMGGRELLEVSQMLGHLNPSMTLDHYSQWIAGQKKINLQKAFG